MKLNKFKALMITLPVLCLLVTGCDVTSPIKYADFIINPNSETLEEDSKRAYDTLVNACKAETLTWTAFNNDFFTNYQPLELRMAQYRHFVTVYNEYYTFLPSSTTNLLNNYRNAHTRNTWDMYSRADDFNHRMCVDKGRFPDHLEDDLMFQAQMLTIIDEATYDEQRGFNVFYDLFFTASEFLRHFYYNPVQYDYDIEMSVATFFARMGDYMFLNDNDKYCVQLFLKRYKNEVIYFTDFFFASVCAYNNATYNSPLK